MKKIILIICLSLLSIFAFASETYYVDTNNGKQAVVIPDGRTEHEVLLTLATAYYNLSYDYESLKTKAEDLATSVEKYVEENRQIRAKYDDLIKDYDLSIKKYQQLSSTEFLKGIAGANIIFGDGFSFDTLSIQAGGLILEKIGVTASIGYSNLNKKLVFGVGAIVLF